MTRLIVVLAMLFLAGCEEQHVHPGPGADLWHPPAGSLDALSSFRWRKSDGKLTKQLPVLQPGDPRIDELIRRYGRARVHVPRLESPGRTRVGSYTLDAYQTAFTRYIQKLVSSRRGFAYCDVIEVHGVTANDVSLTMVSQLPSEPDPEWELWAQIDFRDPLDRADLELVFARVVLDCPGLERQFATVDRICAGSERLSDECLVIAPAL